MLRAHLDFVKRLGARYDGHPDVDHVDLGSVGWWGEWHMSRSSNAPMPTPDTQKKIVDAYLGAFNNTPLLMLIGGGPMLKYPSQASAGSKLSLAMKWQNVGSAPCYKPYRVAYRLTNDQGFQMVFVSEVTVNRWLPGSIELFTDEFFKGPKDLPPGKVYDVADTISLPKDVTPGQYQLSLGVVGAFHRRDTEDAAPHEQARPLVQLGIEGRDKDGWYPVSKLVVTRVRSFRAAGHGVRSAEDSQAWPLQRRHVRDLRAVKVKSL